MAIRNPEKLKVATDRVVKFNNERLKFSAECKKNAMSRRAHSPIQVELMPKYLEYIEEYVEGQKAKGKPITIAGTCLACGISEDTYRRCTRGEYDYIVDEYMATHSLDEPIYIDENGEIKPMLEPSKVFGTMALMIQEQLEENMYSNKGNPVGSIFAAKARYGWKEDEPKTLNQTLVIADSEQAKKALKMLE